MAMLSLYGCTVCCLGVICGCHVTEMTRAVCTLSALRGDRVCAHPSIVPCGWRVSAPWCAYVQDGGTASSRLAQGELSILFLVFSSAPSSQAGNRVNSSVCTVSPPRCVVAALSVLVYKLCPAEVTHCLCRGTLGELEVTLMVP